MVSGFPTCGISTVNNVLLAATLHFGYLSLLFGSASTHYHVFTSCVGRLGVRVLCIVFTLHFAATILRFHTWTYWIGNR